MTCPEFQSHLLLKERLPWDFFIPITVIFKLFTVASGGKVQKGTSHLSILPTSFNFYDFLFCFHKNQNKRTDSPCWEDSPGTETPCTGPARLLGVQPRSWVSSDALASSSAWFQHEVQVQHTLSSSSNFWAKSSWLILINIYLLLTRCSSLAFLGVGS